MNTESSLTDITQALLGDGIAVVRTDTIYGIIARAASREAVEKVYEAKHRNPKKQCIVLIADSAAVPRYADDIVTHGGYDAPPTSVIVPSSDEPAWVLRGGESIAYRLVRDPFLKKVIEKVGPVIAPSANPEGLPPASTISEARDYFGDAVDVYIDGGAVPATVKASRIIEVTRDGRIVEIRA